MRRKIFNEEILTSWKQIDADNWQEIVQEISNIFFEVGSAQFEAMCRQWDLRDLEGVMRSAHTLKSSCGNVGAEQAQDLLVEIELAAAEGKEGALKGLISELVPIFAESTVNLSNFQKQIKPLFAPK